MAIFYMMQGVLDYKLYLFAARSVGHMTTLVELLSVYCRSLENTYIANCAYLIQEIGGIVKLWFDGFCIW